MFCLFKPKSHKKQNSKKSHPIRINQEKSTFYQPTSSTSFDWYTLGDNNKHPREACGIRPSYLNWSWNP